MAVAYISQQMEVVARAVGGARATQILEFADWLDEACEAHGRHPSRQTVEEMQRRFRACQRFMLKAIRGLDDD